MTVRTLISIPRTTDRLSDISGSVRRLNANFAVLIPHVASLLDDDALRRLSKLSLGGERASHDVLLRASQHTDVWVSYGPVSLPLLMI